MQICDTLLMTLDMGAKANSDFLAHGELRIASRCAAKSKRTGLKNERWISNPLTVEGKD